MELKEFIKAVVCETVKATEELTGELGREVKIGKLGESQHTKIKFDLSVITSKRDNGFGIEVSLPNIVNAKIGS